MPEKLKELTVVIDPDGRECLYIDGEAWESRGEISVYSTDLAAAAGDEPCMFRHDSIKHVHDEWPDTLEEALRTPIQLADTGE